jgi:cytochrome c peroxidase
MNYPPRFDPARAAQRLQRLVAGILFFALALAAWPAAADEQLRREAAALFGRVDAAPAAVRGRAEAELGRALFWDARISGDAKTSCASCHSMADWAADRRPVPVDARGKPMPRHAPTVFNSMHQPMLRWLGDRKSGAELAEGLLTGPMGFATKEQAIERLGELGYARAFRAAYPAAEQPLSARNYALAVEAYMATLSTPAPFDRFLAGEDAALSARQKAGLRAFVGTGCAGCHNGPLFGGTTLQRFGLTRDYWLETGSKSVDPGLYALTKREEDRYRFRVPMLRNVAKTAPYFHDGSTDRLERAVSIMATVQLGRTLDQATAADIAAFLESLTGEAPSHFAPPRD